MEHTLKSGQYLIYMVIDNDSINELGIGTRYKQESKIHKKHKVKVQKGKFCKKGLKKTKSNMSIRKTKD